MSGTIAVPSSNVSLTSGGSTNSQSVCVNSAITSITYDILGATGATISSPTALVVDGLPNGVVGNYVGGGVFRISGTPSTTDIITTDIVTIMVFLKNVKKGVSVNKYL